MRVIIVGATPLGIKLAQNLCKRGHEVVFVDQRQEECSFAHAKTCCSTVHGSPHESETLDAAGIREADLLVSALDDDEENLFVCTLAKKFKVGEIVSKINDPQSADAFGILGISAVAGYKDGAVDEMTELAVSKAKGHKSAEQRAPKPPDKENLKIRENKPASGG